MHQLSRLIGPFFVGLLLLPLGFAPPLRQSVAAAVRQPEATPAQIGTMTESESNDTTATANPIVGAGGTWTTRISGTIGSGADLDYYSFVLDQPASSVKITLDSLPADYDLILAASPGATSDQGGDGVDDITTVGGSIAAIGGSIAAIGGSIAAIGGSIAAIGGSIAAIGGSIAAISANTGTDAETIDTFLWQPGTYYVAVGPANGQSSASSYALTVQVSGSNLTRPAQEAPQVEMRVNLQAITYTNGAPITTLYIINSDRMNALYGGQTTQVVSLTNRLDNLARFPPVFGGVHEYGYVLDLADLESVSGGQTPAQIYNEWQANQGNPFYANKVARMIDNVVKAATDPARNGKSCPPIQASCSPGLYYSNARTIIPANPTAPFPDVKYIVLVGGDNVIPFFRTPDLTTIANEADYADYLAALDSAGIINPNNPQGAALKYRMTLSDNPYGSDKPLRFQGFPLFGPNRAVGRLVETPGEILAYLDRWSYLDSCCTGYTIDLRSFNESTPRAYVNGYDFLTDQAQAVSKTLQVGLSAAPPNIGIPAALSGPINDAWTRTDLENSWFEGDLTATVGSGPTLGIFSDSLQNDPSYFHSNSLFSLNSHFDHWQILPARSSAGNFLAQRLLKPAYYANPFGPTPGGYFAAGLGFSVGCHSGYNVIDQGLTFVSTDPRYNLYRSDFAQAFNRHAGNWIGNTGYGYGTADGIDYSERLSLYLTQNLMRDVRVESPPTSGTFVYTGSAIGMALAHAKQRYLRNSASLSEYDAKALTIMTLYGLPFIRVLVDNPLPPPPEEPRVGPLSAPVPTESNAPGGLPVNSAGRLERTITVTINIDASNFETLPRTDSRVIRLGEQNFSVVDSFVDTPGSTFPRPALRVFEGNQVGLPHLPTFAYDISALSSTATQANPARLEVQDVVFVSGEYAPPIPFNPQITQVVTETESPIISTSQEPNFAAGAGIWYPDKFFGFSSIGQGLDQRDQLTATAAQFKADANGVTGLIRGYKQMVFKVYYIDPNAAGASSGQADTSAPVIQSVQINEIAPANTTGASLAAGGGVTLVAIVDNGVGDSNTPVDGVSGIYVQNGTTWTQVTFSKTSVTPDGLERWQAFIPLSPDQLRAIISVTDAAGNVSYYTAKGTFSLGGGQIYLPLVQR